MTYREAISELKRRLLETALWRAGGNKTRAGRLLGMHRTHICRLIRDLGVGRPAGFRAAPPEFSAWLLDMALRDVADRTRFTGRERRCAARAARNANFPG